jgi:hypothetical protein
MTRASGVSDRPAEALVAGVAKRAVKEFRGDDTTDWAAALTYCGVPPRRLRPVRRSRIRGSRTSVG